MRRFGSISKILLVFASVFALTGCFGNDNPSPTSKKYLSSLDMSGALEKNKFYVGDDFDPKGLTFTAKYSDNSLENVTSKMSYSVSKMELSTSFVKASYTFEGTTMDKIIAGFIVSPVEVTSLECKGSLNKTTYFDGESFSSNGLTFYAINNNGTKTDVTSEVTFDKTILHYGDTFVIASYKGHFVKVEGLIVKHRALYNLTVTGKLIKTEYYEGERLDLSGLTFTAYYENGSFKEVTSEVQLLKDKLSLGDKEMLVSYSEDGITKYCTVTGFTVIANVLETLTVVGSLIKTTYYEGEKLSLDGLTFYANYFNGFKKDVTNLITLSKTTLSLNDTSVTAYYAENGVTKSVQVTGFSVVKNAISSLNVIGTLLKTEYYEGEEIDLTGLRFEVRYLNNSVKDVTDSIELSKTILSEGDTSITVSYSEDGITKSAVVSGFAVKKDVLIELVKSGTLLKTKYNEGELIRLDGLTFTAKFKSGKEADVTKSIKLEKTSFVAGDTTLNVSYTYDSVTKTIKLEGFTVIKNVLVNLTYLGTLAKTSYVEGEKIDISGLSFIAHYKDETTSDVTKFVKLEKETVSFGNTSFTVSYTEGEVKKSVVVSGITVTKNVLSSLIVTGSLQKTTYDEGEPIDLTGLTFTAKYVNGSTKDVTSSIKLDNDVAVLGKTSFKASYTEDSITKTVTINGLNVKLVNTEDGITFNVGKVELNNNVAKYYIKDKADPIFWTSVEGSATITGANLTSEVNLLNKNLNSLHLKKPTTGVTKFYLGKDFIDSIGDKGFSFDLYTTVAINSTTSVNNLTDGKGAIIRSDITYQHAAYQWIHYEFSKDRIASNGCFLITKGSTQGDYYFDNIRLITNLDLYTNAGTLYFKNNEPVSIHANKDLSKLNQVFLDGELLNNDKYNVNGSNIVLNDDLFTENGKFVGGEHSITYNIRYSNFEFEKETLYTGIYKSSEVKSTLNLALSYGSAGYTTLQFGKSNKIINENKAIAFEYDGTHVVVPDAALIECLKEENGHKISGEFTLLAISGEFNKNCAEQKINITLTGDSEVKYQREYETDEDYHTFGYSATSGGSNSLDLVSEDYLMLYNRSGLNCVYEQYGSISETIDDKAFGPTGSCYRVQKDMELCNKLGLDYYVIDYFMRNLISARYDVVQQPIIGEGCRFKSEQELEDQIFERLHYYADNPCLKKLVICDEPNFSAMKVVGQVYRCTQKALARYGRPDIEVDANLLPLSAGWGYDDGQALGPAITKPNKDLKNYPTRVATYQNYLSEFLKETQANYISYDIYPLSDIIVDECTYSNLIVAADFAKANNIELHVVSQSFTNCGVNGGTNTRVMDRDDMHYLLNMLMGFGVSRVSFFTYFARWNSREFNPLWNNDTNTGDRNGVIGNMMHEVYDKNNNLIDVEMTDTWYQVQGMLEEMNEFKDVSLSFDYVSCNFIKGNKINHPQETGSLSNKKSAPLWAEQVDDDNYFRFGPLTNISVDVEYCLASTLVDKEGNYMYMVQNVCDPKYESYQTVTMKFSSGSYAVIYENGTSRVVNLIDNKLSVKLSSGNACFVMVY